MSYPNPKAQKTARDAVDKLFSDSENTWIIHYSCESFYDRPEGRSPRITSIAVRKLNDAQTQSFSIHQVAEREHIIFSEIDMHYDALERKMLDLFFSHVGSHRNAKYIHWNMRDINYGFAAIEHRYIVLGGTPIVIQDDKKFDLSRILIDIYGVSYIGHPRLDSLIKKNSIRPLDFLVGAAEAKAFEDRNFAALHQSTLRKVDIIANIAGRVHDRSLKTNTNWWAMRGGKLINVVNWLADLKPLQLVATIGGAAGAIYATIEWVIPYIKTISAS